MGQSWRRNRGLSLCHRNFVLALRLLPTLLGVKRFVYCVQVGAGARVHDICARGPAGESLSIKVDVHEYLADCVRTSGDRPDGVINHLSLCAGQLVNGLVRGGHRAIAGL